MLVGRGMLANAFNAYENNDEVIIFASGVSNSQERGIKAFDRELKLVQSTLAQNPNKLFVYFSTCSMYDPLASKTPYVQHKLRMEQYIQKHAKSYLVLRVSQILGRGKNKTLVNFLFESIVSGDTFEVWKNSNRNLIALEDVVRISNSLIRNKKYHNALYHIANSTFITVPELVKIFEELLHKKANCIYLDKGYAYGKIPQDILDITLELDIMYNNTYYHDHIKKFINTRKELSI